jgi:hypothetical protein
MHGSTIKIIPLVSKISELRTITETYPWIPSELVVDSLVSAKHTLGTTAIYDKCLLYPSHHVKKRQYLCTI